MIAQKDQLEKACKTLFGTTFEFTQETLKYLQESGIKSAYREKAKLYHPDVNSSCTTVSKQDNAFKFNEINNAYNTLIKALHSHKNDKRLHTKIQEQKTKFTSQNNQDFYYNGTLPKRKLRFGEFLFYKKIITWNTLIKSIVWQQRKRPKIGQILKHLQVINNNDIMKILHHALPSEKFGTSALRLGFIQNSHLRDALNYQSSKNFLLGQYFIEHNIINNDKLTYFLNENFNYNLSFK